MLVLIHSFSKYLSVYYVAGPLLGNRVNFTTIVTKAEVVSQGNKVF